MELRKLFPAGLTIFVFTCILIFSLTAEESQGKKITVDDDGDGDYLTIQDAVNASEAGDTIRVLEGNYDENVVVDKSVNLIGDGASNTTIQEEKNVIIIDARNVVFSGFNVVGEGKTNQYDACIYLGFGKNISISDNHCSNNSIGIYLHPGGSSSIINNTCCGNKYGIYLIFGEGNFIVNNTCSENNYGMYIIYSDKGNTLKNNNLFGNGEDLYSEKEESQKNANLLFFSFIGLTLIIALLFIFLHFSVVSNDSSHEIRSHRIIILSLILFLFFIFIPGLLFMEPRGVDFDIILPIYFFIFPFFLIILFHFRNKHRTKDQHLKRRLYQ